MWDTNWRRLFLCEYCRWLFMQQSRIYNYMRCAFFALCIMKSNGSGLGFTVQIYGMLCNILIFTMLSLLQTLLQFIYQPEMLSCKCVTEESKQQSTQQGTSWSFDRDSDWCISAPTWVVCYMQMLHTFVLLVTFSCLTREIIYKCPAAV